MRRVARTRGPFNRWDAPGSRSRRCAQVQVLRLILVRMTVIESLLLGVKGGLRQQASVAASGVFELEERP